MLRWTALLIGLATFQNAAPAQQCPDLSGTFFLQGEDGYVYYILAQQGCESIDITRDNYLYGEKSPPETQSLKLDGKEQKGSAGSGYTASAGTTATFVGSTLWITTAEPGGTARTQTYRLNRDRNLVLDSRPPNHYGPSVAKRVKKR